MKGEELKFWRERHGKSQIELADDLDVSRHSIIKWERSEKIPRILELAIAALDRDLPQIVVGGRGSTPDEILHGRKLLDKAIERATGRES